MFGKIGKLQAKLDTLADRDTEDPDELHDLMTGESSGRGTLLAKRGYDGDGVRVSCDVRPAQGDLLLVLQVVNVFQRAKLNCQVHTCYPYTIMQKW